MTILIYQQEAYRRFVQATVRRCEAQDDGSDRHGVVLDRTVLHAEGGGQPSDHGRVGDRQVLELRREGDEVVHVLDGPVSGEVRVRLDWARRHDHMQQHTAQHLLTAVAQDSQGYATTAFHLGPERCDIELNCADLSPACMAELERACNERISQALAVTMMLVEPEDLAELDIHSRGLPTGHTGKVRLVCIEGVDTNTCGGTHVANTAELQAIKLISTERMRGGTRLFFLAGARVLGWMDSALERERALGELLSCGSADHQPSVQRLLDDARAHRRQMKAAQKELASLWAEELATGEGVASLHRPDGDMAFLRTVGSALHRRCPDRWALLTAGQREGVFLLAGPEDALAERGAEVARILEGKGGGGRGIYQGKASRLDRRQEALERLERAAPGSPLER